MDDAERASEIRERAAFLMTEIDAQLAGIGAKLAEAAGVEGRRRLAARQAALDEAALLLAQAGDPKLELATCEAHYAAAVDLLRRLSSGEG